MRHEVVLLTLWGSGRERQELASLATKYSVVGIQLPRLTALGNCLRALPTSTPLQGAYCRSTTLEKTFIQALGGFPAADSKLPAALRGPFDMVHVEHLRAAYLGQLIPPTVPAVVDAVDCISLLMERTQQHSHRFRQRLLARFELGRMRRFEGQVLEPFDGVMVTSPIDGAALRELNSRLNVTVVAHAVDHEYFGLSTLDRDPDTIVFVGKMSYHANATAACFFAKEVFPLIRAKRPSARLFIVGSDPPADVRCLERDEGVTITGYVADVRPYLGRARVAVAPVVVKVGVQNKILEAMAVGTPVVTTPAGVEGLDARPDRDLLVAAEPAAFAAKVASLLDDDATCCRLSIAGRRYVEEHHRWDVAASRVEVVYEAARAAKATSSQIRGIRAPFPKFAW